MLHLSYYHSEVPINQLNVEEYNSCRKGAQ
jgi:hypothetical protein